MSSEVAHVSISHRSSHSTMGVEEEELPSSDRELVGVLSGERARDHSEFRSLWRQLVLCPQAVRHI